MPSGVRGIGQFKTTVYAVFSGQGNMDVPDETEKTALVADFLRQNETLTKYVRGYVERIRSVARLADPTLDEGFNLAILYQPGAGDQPHELAVISRQYGRVKLAQHEALYDRLVYPLIFWSGTGGCGVAEGEPIQGAATVIRKAAISLVMRPRDHFIHRLPTLREEFICATEGRLVNMNIKFLISAQRIMAEEDELRYDADLAEKSFGLRTFVPSLVLGTDS
jgi:hypothetical protein